MSYRLPFTPSHSSLSTFTTCPRKYQAQYVTRETPYTPSVAGDLGTCVHKLAEWYVDYLTGTPSALGSLIAAPLSQPVYAAVLAAVKPRFVPSQAELESHFSVMQAFIATLPIRPGMSVFQEVKLAGSFDWVGCGYKDKDAFFRAILDLLIVAGNMALVCDWKSSKTMKATEQLARSALIVMMNYPQVQEVHTMYVSSRGQMPIKDVYRRADMLDLHNEISTKCTQLEECYEHNTWPAIKSGLCRDYCGVSSCHYCGRK